MYVNGWEQSSTYACDEAVRRADKVADVTIGRTVLHTSAN